MIEENQIAIRRVVYMDESYIKNYCRHSDSLYDPNDEQDLTTVAHHKGQRYCFIAAIIDADHTVPEQDRTAVQKACLIKKPSTFFKAAKSKPKTTMECLIMITLCRGCGLSLMD